MEHIKIAILDLYDGVANQGMRNIKQIIENQSLMSGISLSYHIFDVRGKEEVPDIADFDIYISSGGPGSPFEGIGTKWEENYFNWLENLWQFNQKNEEKKKYAFFICHSFQMICRFFEIGKVSERKSVSFGIFPVHQISKSKEEVFFQNLPEPFYAVDNRNWQVVEPNYQKIKDLGAEILALEKIRPHVDLERALMAIRFSEEIFAVQFHPEADVEGMQTYFFDEKKKAEIIEIHGEAKYNEMVEHLSDPDKILLTRQTMIPNFLSQAIESTQKVYF